MKKTITLLFVLLAAASVGAQNISLPRPLRNGQETQTDNTNPRTIQFFAGGNINSNFGYYFSIAPEIGVYATEWLRFGVGPRYEMSFNTSREKVNHSFGATVFAEAIVAKYLIGHVGYEFLNYPEWNDVDDFGNPIDERRNTHALALGIGFHSRLTNNIGLYALYVLYPVQSENTHYKKFLPMFARIGITMDF